MSKQWCFHTIGMEYYSATEHPQLQGRIANALCEVKEARLRGHTMQDSIYQVLEEAKLSGWEQIRGCQRLRMQGGFDYKGVGGRRETFAVVRQLLFFGVVVVA